MEKRPLYEDEMTLGEFLRGLAGILRWIKSNLLGLALCAILGVAASIFYAYQKPTVYNAQLTFILADDNGGQMGGLSGVLGQLGLPFSTGKYNVDKLLEVAKARRITYKALLQKVVVNGKNDLLANHFLSTYELPKKWVRNGKTEMADFQFSNTEEEVLTIEELFAIKQIHQLLMGSGENRKDALVNLAYGNPDYVMSYDVATIEEELSIETAKLLYKGLEEFYVEKSVGNYQTTYDLIKTKRDSINTILVSTEYSIARLRDQSANTYASTNNVKINTLSTQVIGLRLALQKAEENLAIAEYALRTNRPMIDIIDTPISPLSPSKPSLLRYIVLGLVLGVALYMMLYIGKIVVKMV